MLARLNDYKSIAMLAIIAALLIGLYVYIHGLKVQIADLKGSLKDSYVELANSTLEVSRLEKALDKQSAEIDKLKVNEQKAYKKLAEWKAKPAKIRYNVIYKIRKVKSNDCTQIKDTINSIRRIKYSDL